MMTNTKKHESALATLTMSQLKETWIATETSQDENIPTVRGWIMDEFEKRDADGFDTFLETNNLDAIRGN